MLVNVCGLGRLVSEPQRDRGDVYAFGAQEHRVGVAQGVRCGSFGRQQRAVGGCGGDVPGDDRADAVAAERATLPGGEQRLVGLAATFFEPGTRAPDIVRAKPAA